jgi:hypothetical protein
MRAGLAKDVARIFSAIRQNMSRVFAADFGKRCYANLETEGHAPAQIIPSLVTIANDT